MRIPRCCERAAEATGTRLRLLRAVRDCRRPEEPPLSQSSSSSSSSSAAAAAAAAAMASMGGPSTRLSRAGSSSNAQDFNKQQQLQQQQQQQNSNSRAATTSSVLTRRRSGAAALIRQSSSSMNSTAAAAAAAAAAASAAATAATRSLRSSSSLRVSAKDKTEDKQEKGPPLSAAAADAAAAAAFVFPDSSDPEQHVALTYPGGPTAFAAYMRAAKKSMRSSYIAALLLLLLFAAAFAAALFFYRDTSSLRHTYPGPQQLLQQMQQLLQQQQQQLQQQQQQQHDGSAPLNETEDESNASATAQTAAAAAAAAAAADELPPGAPIPGVPLQKQIGAEGSWAPAAAAAFEGLVLGVVQQNVSSSSSDVSSSLNPLSLWLQRRPRCIGDTLAAGVVAADTPEGEPLLLLPRHLLLSTADAPPLYKEKCMLQQRSSRTQPQQQQQQQQQQLVPCTPEELLAVLLLKELLLLRRLQQQNPAAAAAFSSSCLLRTNKKNAPYFGPFLWQALPLLLPQQGEQQLLLEQQLLQLARGPLAAELADSTKEDIKKAVSLVHARSVWDGEGRVAVSALDELQEYHWNADLATQHETSAEGLIWRAHRDTRKGDKLFINYGQYNNAYLLFHFGVETKDNPWGPAFFYRKEAGDTPHAALPNGFTSISIIRSTVSSSLLPDWLQKTAWAPKGGPCHPPLGGPPCEVSNLDVEEPVADRVVAATGINEEGEEGIICGQQIFNLRAFGRGSFVLSLFGAVGGVDATVYKCLRLLRFGDTYNNNKDNKDNNNNKDSNNYNNLVKREMLTATHLRDACNIHYKQLDKAEQALQGGLAAVERQLLLLQLQGTPEAAAEAKEEIERLQSMLRAAASNKQQTERCINYFTDIIHRLQALPTETNQSI